jgi:hypothetical protein
MSSSVPRTEISFLPAPTRLGCLAVVSAVLGSACAADATPHGDQNQCTECMIEVDVVAEIRRDVEDDLFPGAVMGAVVDSRGRSWVLFPQSVSQFDVDGSFRASVGREGEGPGEFKTASHIVLLPDDSIAIFDAALSRATIISRDLSVVRTVDIPRVVLWNVHVLRWPDAVVLNGLASRGGMAGWPLHFVDLSAQPASITRSFGANGGEYRISDHGSLRQEIASAIDGSLWTADVVNYTLRKWDVEGRLIHTLHRTPDWFGSQTNFYSPGTKTSPPPPRIRGINEDSNGRMVVIAHVARPDWMRAWEGLEDIPAGSGEVAVSELPSYEDLYRTRIELVDLETGRLLSSQDTDYLLQARLQGNLIGAVLRNGAGIAILSVKVRDR